MTAEDQVRAAEERRGAAMLAGDAPAMDPLLAEGLTFVHANGGVDDKPTLLAKMQGGAIVYHSIAWSEPTIDVRDAVAAMRGVMTLQVTVAGVDKTLHNRAILLWERDAAGAWRLFHFQSTPIQGR
jgi:ketosteroid isomerase-like protein